MIQDLKKPHTISNFPRKKDNAGLVRLFKIIQEADKDGISTRKSCEQAFHTRNYGMRAINRAYDDGYIKRFGKNKRGHNKINYLSDKGKGAAKSTAATRGRRIIIIRNITNLKYWKR